MRAFAPWLALAILIVPTLDAGSPPPSSGTEDRPEVQDVAGNVVYSPLYTGARDRDHIDLLAAWFSYDDQTDAITLTLKVATLVGVTEKTRGYDIAYQLDGNISQGSDSPGLLRFQNQKLVSSGDDWRQKVEYYRSTTPGAGEGAPISYTFTTTIDSPGYMRWTVPAEPLRKLGDTLSGFRVLLLEDQYVAGRDFAVINMNEVRAGTTYEFGSLSRMMPAETPAEAPTVASESAGADGDTTDRTPGFLFVVALLGLGWAATQKRRKP